MIINIITERYYFKTFTFSQLYRYLLNGASVPNQLNLSNYFLNVNLLKVALHFNASILCLDFDDLEEFSMKVNDFKQKSKIKILLI